MSDKIQRELFVTYRVKVQKPQDALAVVVRTSPPVLAQVGLVVQHLGEDDFIAIMKPGNVLDPPDMFGRFAAIKDLSESVAIKAAEPYSELIRTPPMIMDGNTKVKAKQRAFFGSPARSMAVMAAKKGK